ncbi:regulatory protein RecX [Alicyclobacillus shizuokensis]|uniref:regulatory protein RecX n=1 Tax=Alicyclobacillus shizuokensis TaxID=392014 RepID=UPI000837144C|nr:regulatory protein RecX [Alicyclobacillus shizuokensis]MCL6626338.1 recombination regulator RecX [Alicyclobacillus shizuokensis]
MKNEQDSQRPEPQIPGKWEPDSAEAALPADGSCERREWKIASVSEVTGQPDWLRVQFADRPEIVVALRDWVDGRFKVGQTVDTEMLAQLERSAQELAAFEAALRYLRRAHTEAEVRSHLRRKGYPKDAREGAIARLKRMGAIDDEAYVARFIEVKAGRMSRRELSWRLRQKGVEGRVLSAHMDDERTRQAERDTCRQHAQKYWNRLKDHDPSVRARKLAAYLGRRGFPADECRAAIHEMLSRADADSVYEDTDWI